MPPPTIPPLLLLTCGQARPACFPLPNHAWDDVNFNVIIIRLWLTTRAMNIATLAAAFGTSCQTSSCIPLTVH